MEKTELNKYAECIMAMTTDYLMGNYDEELYKSIIQTIAKRINE